MKLVSLASKVDRRTETCNFHIKSNMIFQWRYVRIQMENDDRVIEPSIIVLKWNWL